MSRPETTATFFLTRKHRSEIIRVEGWPDGSRHIRVRQGQYVSARLKRQTIYHTYHETFEMAKNCARVDLEIKVKELSAALAEARERLDKVVMLHEGDV